MIMHKTLKKVLCALAIATLTLLPASMQADFFAFRKLVKKENGKPDKIVYLLYDAHGSVVTDLEITAKAAEEIEQSKQEAYNIYQAKIKEVAKAENSQQQIQEIFKDVVAARNKALEKIFAYLATLSNLKKQQADVAEVVLNYGFSLVNEDWPVVENMFGDIDSYRACDWDLYTKMIDALNCKINVYVSPMIGLGRKLTRKFSINKFEKVSNEKNIYFYNADFRLPHNLITKNCEDDTLLVDTKILSAIKELFATYAQSAVIVSAGFVHCHNVTKQLISDGYTDDHIIFSADLQNERKNDLTLNKLLDDLKQNSLDNSNHYGQLLFQLVKYPLNVREVFEKELGVKIEQKKETPVEQPKPKNTEEKLSIPIPQKQNQTATEKQAVQNNNSLFGVNTESLTCFFKSTLLSVCTTYLALWCAKQVEKQINSRWPAKSWTSVGLQALTKIACGGGSTYGHFKIMNPTKETATPWALGSISGALPYTCVGQRLLKSIRLHMNK